MEFRPFLQIHPVYSKIVNIKKDQEILKRSCVRLVSNTISLLVEKSPSEIKNVCILGAPKFAEQLISTMLSMKISGKNVFLKSNLLFCRRYGPIHYTKCDNI
jgi:hypothetical protein